MEIVGGGFGALLLLFLGFLLYRAMATTRATRRLDEEIAAQVEPVWAALERAEEVETALLDRLAADPLTRNELHDMLRFRRRLDLFPDRYRHPAAFAEADLVRWLRHPNELGCVPDEIERMALVEQESSPGGPMVDYYLFRFRMHPPHWAAEKGWLAGVAGPYDGVQSDASAAGTFSRFEPYDSRPPDQHVALIHALLRR